MGGKAKNGTPRSLSQRRSLGDLEPWPSFFRGSLSGRFPQLMEELFREWPGTGGAQVLLPAMDVSDDDERYTVTVELPGIAIK